jgi:hypothetical protein
VERDNAIDEGVTHPSDKRYKTDITPIDNAIDKINRMNGVKFNWKREAFPDKNFSADPQIGLIAQEVEAVLPEVVKTDDQGYKSLAYNKLIAVLVEAIKELNAKVEQLEAAGN